MEKLKIFERLPKKLLEDIIQSSKPMDIPKGTEILREGQYVKVVPIVISGAIKVYSSFEEKELLLYYIIANESCIMSFTAGINNEESKVFAVTEEDTSALLVPVRKINEWIKEFPEFNFLFFKLFNLRYNDLLESINQVLFNKMDQRLYDYLLKKSKINKTQIFKISHREMANDLGTAREVVSRVMKKLENENKIEQVGQSIKIIDL